MHCKWCSLAFKPEDFKVDYQEHFYHPECWMKKLNSIGAASSGPAPAHANDGMYPGSRHDEDAREDAEEKPDWMKDS